VIAMVVMLMEKVPTSARGELTRWLLELRPGVFVGNISALVRDKLWDMLCQKLRGGNALLIYSATTEQSFAIRTHGESGRVIREFEAISPDQIQ